MTEHKSTALQYIAGSSEPADGPQAKGMAQIARKALSTCTRCDGSGRIAICHPNDGKTHILCPKCG